eukprot:TRINITY_DN22037_c0_g1_i2.p1 TRINITY_DN22037_c0_g1~~TRINITY_DN22037_c0_g1_i2.p1  ORF type:complete len:339 (-),score=43.47 TRINITY_DN22037_c0_g1_i2:450-1409(-)
MWEVPLNAVIGDKGFIEAVGRAPTDGDSEDVRIQHHLDFVVKQLRAAGAALPRRQHALDLLEAYARDGCFPKHTRQPATRSPIFVDASGTPCAVAHLMLETGAVELCKAVDQTCHFSLIEDMFADKSKQPLAADICAWADSVALTPRELAMIQPVYNAKQEYKVALIVLLSYFLLGTSCVPCFAGLVNMFMALRASCSVNLVEWALAALAILHCTFGIVGAVAGGAGCLKPDSDAAQKTGQYTVAQYILGYCTFYMVSVPVVVTLLTLATIWNKADETECSETKGLIWIITWAVLGFLLLVWAILSCLRYKSYTKTMKR